MTLIDESIIKQRIRLAGIGDVVLVDCKKSGACEPRRNVFLVKADGEVVWQIDACVESHGVNEYSNIYLGEGDTLMAYSSNGIEYTVDRATGKILDKELVR